MTLLPGAPQDFARAAHIEPFGRDKTTTRRDFTR
jgi:hypothetical protein